MKNKTIVIISAVIIAAVVIAGFAVGVTVISKKDSDESYFDNLNIARLENIGVKESLDGKYRIAEAYEFGYKGAIEIGKNQEDIASVCFNTCLLEKDDVKEDIQKKVFDFVSAYSKTLGLEIIEAPKIISFTDDEAFKNKPEDDFEALMAGYVQFEYSYRDASGVLWISRIYSPTENHLYGSVIMLKDESDYEGFIPQINMKKEVEK